MAYDVQIVIDSREPHVLADWWAETLGWPVEPSNEEMIRELVAQGHAQESDTMTHNGVLVWRVGAALRHPDESESSMGGRILFLAVPERKTVKNRVHLDVAVGAEQADAEVERLVARGATVLHHGQQGPFTWITMSDPEGNEFCVSREG